ncbi:SulP family inorganic anion transporter [Caminibacter mediatlanticus TB-2]|uniref:SulP family inorganic anion transporter n=1 Tax=Caminibacter mediatlanticus TB-2 TaxID=391592 RepID=A0ABX5V9R0_9BACT|nr:SulP family inorganic anion transporter [Caminibacter mediatlanticus]QCT94998.1 SulP family inorganic anion transporter [Caminibacter mediatlanticus TB-2]
MFFQILQNYNAKNIKNDILAGIVTSIALVPEVVAFALVAGLSPQMGLYTAFILGLISAIIGGKAGLISGAAGSIAVVIVSLVQKYGVEYLLWAVIFAGIIQILIGVFKLAKFIRLVPMPAIYGFVNGLAIVIATSQFRFFEGESYWIYILVALSMAIIYFMPKITKTIPSTLGAIIIITAIVNIFHINTKTVADLGEISGTFPHFHIPLAPLNLETLKIILPYSIIIALIGLIETLLTMEVLEELDKERGDGNKEAIAQGVGNTTCGFFGAMPGCAMIGQTLINHTSGGRGKLSSIVAAIMIILYVVLIPDAIKIVPLAVLIGIMFVVSIATFEWASIEKIKKMPREDAFVLIITTIITIFTDLAIAVITGVIISALVFAWKHAKVYFHTYEEDGKKIYKFEGPLFFGSSRSFVESFDVENDPKEVIMDFENVRVMDISGVEAIDKVTKKYKETGKKLIIRHLSKECKKLLENAKDFCEFEEDLDYKIAVDANKLK